MGNWTLYNKYQDEKYLWSIWPLPIPVLSLDMKSFVSEIINVDLSKKTISVIDDHDWGMCMKVISVHWEPDA